MRVFILLFNAGTNNEGLHSLQIGDHNVVLMFEEEDDATRYALLLEAQDFPVPGVEAFDQEEIEEFCQSSSYQCQIVPKGFVPQSDAERLLLAPPETNVDDAEWQINRHAVENQADSDDSDSTMPKDALEQIRRQLEGLL
ncbi:DUF3110 domain-containing protein [Phormidium sp. CLA17]|uniref:DUF3110 domain-containing protein n=1 Tax=Leptolyngbya sp. Cla-17 TaxID=2803751 RepID=UPI00149245E3|nr:DUF3110 domain-containing protein [Leptolyngbya sp. Cla-17]MBM0742778.1 DUF3110 domain-containing protein [Leptolyngbya sp. Cla-17]